MKRIDWKVFVLLGIIVSVAVGFLYGTGILGGDSGDPGSSGDPLASTSYADGTINRRVQELDARIVTLEAKIQSLENEITQLTGGDIDPDAPAGSGGGGTGATNPTPTNPGTTTPPPTQGSPITLENVGKTGNVTSEVVNLRESASTSSNIKRRLSPSDTFTITKLENDWYQVQLSDGTVGWVHGPLVRVR